MGIADRDYYRNDRTTAGNRAGRVSPWSVNTWIIVVNIAVYVLNSLTQPRKGGLAIDQLGRTVGRVPDFGGRFFEWGFFSSETALSRLQVWRFISFQFLHDPFTLLHIAFNCFALYMFGPIIESLLGRRRYLAFYLLCGIAGPLTYLLIQVLGILPMASSTPLVGASAGVFGVLVAAARTAPNEWVQLLFPPGVPIRLQTFAWIMVGIAALIVYTNGQNAGGQAAHLGGAAMGFWLITNPQLLNLAQRWPRRGPKMKITY